MIKLLKSVWVTLQKLRHHKHHVIHPNFNIFSYNFREFSKRHELFNNFITRTQGVKIYKKHYLLSFRQKSVLFRRMLKKEPIFVQKNISKRNNVFCKFWTTLDSFSDPFLTSSFRKQIRVQYLKIYEKNL